METLARLSKKIAEKFIALTNRIYTKIAEKEHKRSQGHISWRRYIYLVEKQTKRKQWQY